MENLITVALVQRFLLAKGWRRVDCATHPHDPAWERNDGERMLGINGGVPQMDAVANFERVPRDELAARLGLCVAASQLDHRLATIKQSLSTAADERVAEHLSLLSTVIEVERDEYLRKAGVDPEAWKRAR